MIQDRDQACRLLLSGLALAVLDSEPCEVPGPKNLSQALGSDRIYM